ncbi:Hypothetical protein D9617_37g012120 [Elsinoe fawcettii]|nr:Hypothetical protein D9617_37g012120 [Elsinoe fawcettii]
MLDPRGFPRPPKLERITKEILIKWPGPNGSTIAHTRNAFWVLETYHPPTYYIPPSDVKIPLEKLSRKTFCEWKGAASYFTFDTPDGKRIDSRVWTYEDPTPGFRDIKDYLCFYADDRWDCVVDGEKVEPQPGDFYGGWMTKDIVRESVKGAPGTRFW